MKLIAQHDIFMAQTQVPTFFSPRRSRVSPLQDEAPEYLTGAGGPIHRGRARGQDFGSLSTDRFYVLRPSAAEVESRAPAKAGGSRMHWLDPRAIQYIRMYQLRRSSKPSELIKQYTIAEGTQRTKNHLALPAKYLTKHILP